MAYPVLIPVIIGVGIATALFYYINVEQPRAEAHRRTQTNRNQNARIGRRRSNVSTTSWDNSSCTICLEENCDAVVNPCGHLFHAHCILKWFDQKKKSCPDCRQRILSAKLRGDFN